VQGRIETTGRALVFCAAVAVLAGCVRPSTVDNGPQLARSTMEAPTSGRARDGLDACLDAIAPQRKEPTYPALSYACAVRAEPSPAAQTLEQQQLRKLADLVLSSDGQRFRERMLAPGITLAVATMPPGTYLFADSFGVNRGDQLGVVPGKGLAMVRFRPNQGRAEDANYPPEGIFVPVTLTGEVAGHSGDMRITLRAIEGPALWTEGWADASAQAYLRLLERTRLNQESARGFRDPSKLRIHSNGIYLMEPYDPDRIPLLMIHGLRSNPSIWRTLTLAVLKDPEAHARFQVWHAFYPTGTPPFYAASKARERLSGLLDRLDPSGTDVAHRHVALIGHSMGGLISRALVTKDNGALWDATFTVPAAVLPVSPERREDFEKILSLGHEPEIGFVGFLNTPHRGSRTADGAIGRFADSLVMLPEAFRSIFAEDLDYLPYTTPEMRQFLEPGGPSSVDALSPLHPLLRRMAELPIAPEVDIVSVVGVRKGPACVTTPGCVATDGVVTYQSAHLDQGKELLIRSAHDGYDKPEAIAFLLAELKAWAAGL
jgi:pimeloyl-ACP methyl ester carboxylesterase